MKLNQKTNKNKINDIANLFYNDKINIVFTNKNATGMFELIKKNFTTPMGTLWKFIFPVFWIVIFCFRRGQQINAEMLLVLFVRLCAKPSILDMNWNALIARRKKINSIFLLSH